MYDAVEKEAALIDIGGPVDSLVAHIRKSDLQLKYVFITHGHKEDIIKSVRRLYAMLPDSTKVYPGHGESTDVGSEKRENEEVTVGSAAVQN